MVTPFLRSPYNYDRRSVTISTGLQCDDPSRAQQQFKLDSDPNQIIKQFARTNDPSLLTVKNPQYGDFSGISDYQTALNAVIKADEAFLSLPATIRSRFSNDPAQLLAFLGNPANRQEAVKLGLFKDTSGAPRDTDSAVGASGVSKPAKQAKSSKTPVSPAPDASQDAE